MFFFQDHFKTNPNEFQCDECSKKFASPNRLEIHKKKPCDQEKSKGCEECNLIFTHFTKKALFMNYYWQKLIFFWVIVIRDVVLLLTSAISIENLPYCSRLLLQVLQDQDLGPTSSLGPNFSEKFLIDLNSLSMLQQCLSKKGSHRRQL